MKPSASMTIAVVLTVASVSWSQQTTTRPVSPRRIRAPVITVFLPDLCEGAVDPYYPGRQREQFYRAAGVDNELTTDEFLADSRRKDGFVRAFDRWEAMLLYDADASETIDWPEAKQCRLGFRKKTLAIFDKDGDRHLTRQERNEANRALATGKLTPDTLDSVLSADGLEEFLDDLIEDYDEASAPSETAYRETPAQRLEPPGELSADRWQVEQSAALSARRTVASADLIPWNRIRNGFGVLVFDTTGDGKLNRTERRTADRFREQLARVVVRQLEKSLGPPKHGRPGRPDAVTVVAQLNHAAESASSASAIAADANHDGGVTGAEASQFADKVVRSVLVWGEGFCFAHDHNGDGRLGQLELDLLLRAISRELARRCARHDANRDRRLNSQEIADLVLVLAREMRILPRPTQ